MVRAQLDTGMQRMMMDPYLTPYTQLTQMDQGIKCKN